jgi:hypothetical protein
LITVDRDEEGSGRSCTCYSIATTTVMQNIVKCE